MTFEIFENTKGVGRDFGIHGYKFMAVNIRWRNSKKSKTPTTPMMYLNKEILNFVGDHKRALLFFDKETNTIGITFCHDENNTFRVIRETGKQTSFMISVAPFLKHIGYTVEKNGLSTTYKAFIDKNSGMLLINLEDIVWTHKKAVSSKDGVSKRASKLGLDLGNNDYVYKRETLPGKIEEEIKQILPTERVEKDPFVEKVMEKIREKEKVKKQCPILEWDCSIKKFIISKKKH